MNGFEYATHEKMQGIHAQLIMKSQGNTLDASSIEPIIKKEFPEVVGYSPQNIAQAILSTKGSNDMANVVMLKALDPYKESRTSAIAAKIIQPSIKAPLDTLIYKNYIVIGSQSAESLHLSVGDTIELIYVARQSNKDDSLNIEKTKTIISGIFKTGIEEFDAGLVFCSNELYSNMFAQKGVDQITLKLAGNADETETIQKLKQRFGIDVYSWKDLYPALVSALRLEKYVMFIILALITLVASMNMISLLFMHIIQKRGDIAILKSMGMSSRRISSIFFIMGLTITCIASLCGLAAAWVIGLLLKKYPLITLPDAYYVSHIPVDLNINVFGIIFAVIMLMSIIATWLPVSKIKKIQVADTLRFEA